MDRRSLRTGAVSTLALAGVAVLGACSGGNDGAVGCADMSGSWTIVEVADSTHCGGGISTEEKSATIVQSECGFTLTTEDETLTGSIRGNAISGTSSAPLDDGGTLSGTFRGKVSEDASEGTGTMEWKVDDGLVQCSGSTQVIARRDTADDDGLPSSRSADALCQRTADCSGTSFSDAELELCRQTAAAAFELVVDDATTGECISALSCDQLADSETVQACLDLDEETITCDGTTLQGCTYSGKCAAVACSAVCGLLGLSVDHCGMDDEKGHDVCWCR